MSSTTILVIAAVVGVFIYAVWQSRGDIDGEQAQQRVAAGARLLDVRTAAEFASGHLEGALNIPLHQLQQRHGELGPAGQEVVVYCQSGMRSARAAALLRGLGYQAVNLGAMANGRTR